MEKNSEHLIKYFKHYLGTDVFVRNEIFLQNYNGNEFGKLNGLYPLYSNPTLGEQKIYWQYTCHNNSTGQSLFDGTLLLRPLEGLIVPIKNSNNEQILPITEIAKINNIKFESTPEFYVEERTKTLYYACKEIKDDLCITHGIEFDLEEFGFDVFIHIKSIEKFPNLFESYSLTEIFKSQLFDDETEIDIVNFFPIPKINETMEFLHQNWFDLYNLIDNKFAYNYYSFEDKLKDLKLI